MFKCFQIIICSGLMLLGAVSVQAQSTDTLYTRAIHFYLNGGLDVPALNLSDRADYGYHLSPTVGFQPFPESPEVELQIQAFYANFPAQSAFYNKHRILGVGGNLKLSINSLTPPYPYLVGGVGYARVKVSPAKSGPQRNQPEFEESHPYLNGGIGLDWPTGKQISWFVEGRAVGVAGGYIGDYIFLSLSIGLRY